VLVNYDSHLYVHHLLTFSFKISFQKQLDLFKQNWVGRICREWEVRSVQIKSLTPLGVIWRAQKDNLFKIQLFIILLFFYHMKIWQRPVRGHVQMTFVVNQSNLSLPDSEIGKLSKVLVCSILIGWWCSLRWKLRRSSAHDLLWTAVRSSYDSIMKSCILIRLTEIGHFDKYFKIISWTTCSNELIFGMEHPQDKEIQICLHNYMDWSRPQSSILILVAIWLVTVKNQVPFSKSRSQG